MQKHLVLIITIFYSLVAFAFYAGMALFFDFMLQITCFVSLLSLDTDRQTNNRLDIFCFIKVSKIEATLTRDEGTLHKFVKKIYVPCLMNVISRLLVMIVFFGWLCVSIAMIPRIEIGLDQDMAFPEDSFVLKYFQTLKSELSIGVPTYFVLKGGLNYSDYNDQNLVCGGPNCNLDSLSTQIYTNSKIPETSYIARPASSWIDDYFDWTLIDDCCKTDVNGEFRPHSASGGTKYSCKRTLTPQNRPVPKNFNKYLSFFLQDNPDEVCAKAGHASYGNGLNIYKNPDTKENTAGASYFMSFHTILKTSADYYNALKSARKIAENITSTIRKSMRENKRNEQDVMNVEVFPYSVFYVFYEQYLTM